jgi:hypothetical protein
VGPCAYSERSWGPWRGGMARKWRRALHVIQRQRRRHRASRTREAPGALVPHGLGRKGSGIATHLSPKRSGTAAEGGATSCSLCAVAHASHRHCPTMLTAMASAGPS